jgi:mannose/fructose-specific phosphotransferase system component IIA
MILGPAEGLRALSNAGKSSEQITAEVRDWLADRKPDEGRIILLDDYGGSCATCAQIASEGDPRIAVISGVNLAMMLGFLTWRETTDFNELPNRLVQKGREAIVLVGGR